MARVADASGRPVGSRARGAAAAGPLASSGLLRRMRSAEGKRDGDQGVQPAVATASARGKSLRLFVDALRDEAHAEHDAAIRRIEAQPANDMPVSEFYPRSGAHHVSGGSAIEWCMAPALRAVQRRECASVSASPPPPPHAASRTPSFAWTLDDASAASARGTASSLRRRRPLLHATRRRPRRARCCRSLMSTARGSRRSTRRTCAHVALRWRWQPCAEGGGGGIAGSDRGASLPPPRPSAGIWRRRLEQKPLQHAAATPTAGPQFARATWACCCRWRAARFVAREHVSAVASPRQPRLRRRRPRAAPPPQPQRRCRRRRHVVVALASSSSSSEAPRGGVAWAAGAAERAGARDGCGAPPAARARAAVFRRRPQRQRGRCGSVAASAKEMEVAAAAEELEVAAVLAEHDATAATPPQRR